MRKTIIDYITKRNWHFHFHQDNENIMIFGIETESGKFSCVIDIEEDKNRFVVFSIYPLHVPQSLRVEAAELLIRLNYSLYLGSFEMDFEDGEIRLKTSVINDENTIEQGILKHIIDTNIMSMSDNFKIFNEFITQKSSLKESISVIEQAI